MKTKRELLEGLIGKEIWVDIVNNYGVIIIKKPMITSSFDIIIEVGSDMIKVEEYNLNNSLEVNKIYYSIDNIAGIEEI